jgi:hypothetical protein
MVNFVSISTMKYLLEAAFFSGQKHPNAEKYHGQTQPLPHA